MVAGQDADKYDLSSKQLTASDFVLGKTLGTGAFGRVRSAWNGSSTRENPFGVHMQKGTNRYKIWNHYEMRIATYSPKVGLATVIIDPYQLHIWCVISHVGTIADSKEFDLSAHEFLFCWCHWSKWVSITGCSLLGHVGSMLINE